MSRHTVSSRARLSCEQLGVCRSSHRQDCSAHCAHSRWYFSPGTIAGGRVRSRRRGTATWWSFAPALVLTLLCAALALWLATAAGGAP